MTTLCYIEKDDSYLMMHRTVKKKGRRAKAAAVMTGAEVFYHF